MRKRDIERKVREIFPKPTIDVDFPLRDTKLFSICLNHDNTLDLLHFRQLLKLSKEFKTNNITLDQYEGVIYIDVDMRRGT